MTFSSDVAGGHLIGGAVGDNLILRTIVRIRGKSTRAQPRSIESQMAVIPRTLRVHALRIKEVHNTVF